MTYVNYIVSLFSNIKWVKNKCGCLCVFPLISFTLVITRQSYFHTRRHRKSIIAYNIHVSVKRFN